MSYEAFIMFFIIGRKRYNTPKTSFSDIKRINPNKSHSLIYFYSGQSSKNLVKV